MRRRRIRVGERVEIVEGHYWPHSKFGTVVRKDPIVSGKRIISYWFLVLLDGEDEPKLFPRSYIAT